NHNTHSQRFSCTYASSAQKVNPAAARSTCASELCTKNTGYIEVHATVAIATSMFATYFAKRKRPRRVNAAIASIAMRVTTTEYAVAFHAAARYAITSGGCAFEGVV